MFQQVRIINNFTNDAIRLDTKQPFVRPENFDQYFPLLQI
jgi:hypothetical protein